MFEIKRSCKNCKYYFTYYKNSYITEHLWGGCEKGNFGDYDIKYYGDLENAFLKEHTCDKHIYTGGFSFLLKIKGFLEHVGFKCLK